MGLFSKKNRKDEQPEISHDLEKLGDQLQKSLEKLYLFQDTDCFNHFTQILHTTRNAAILDIWSAKTQDQLMEKRGRAQAVKDIIVMIDRAVSSGTLASKKTTDQERKKAKFGFRRVSNQAGSAI